MADEVLAGGVVGLEEGERPHQGHRERRASDGQGDRFGERLDLCLRAAEIGRHPLTEQDADRR